MKYSYILLLLCFLSFNNVWSQLPVINYCDGHEFVDLGLVDEKGNHVLWATCNVGRVEAEISDCGDFFAWGESLVQSSAYNLGSYQLARSFGIFKYNKEDKLTVLGPEDDVASIQWSLRWHIPTVKEFDQLVKECTWKWHSVDGINGYLVTGSNGNSIFLPISGYRQNNLDFRKENGYYWTANLADDPSYALCFSFSSSKVNTINKEYRYTGRCIRPVCILPKSK